MLKKIPVSDARVGMFLHRLDGAWIDHPFWKSKFTISDPADLAKLQGSAVRFCWIDPEIGLDVADTFVAEPAAPPQQPADRLPAQPSQDAAKPVPAGPTRSMADELNQAAAICKKGRAAVSAMFREARLGRAVDTEQCLPLVQEVTDSVLRNPSALVSLARLKTADDYSYMHSIAVCALMVALARQLGHAPDACREAGLAGMLHDLGKAMMPLEVLNKPGRLTDDEMAIMRSHPLQGHRLLTEAGGAPAAALEVCLHHHERPDGKGYPHGLVGDELSELARMGAICDVYDAITSNRPYKAGWDPAESIAQMASWKGQFDDRLFAAFVQSLGIYPVGALLRLASGKLAVVMEQNPANLVQPVVKAFYSTKSQMPITPVRIDLSHPSCSDRIVSRESAAKWGLTKADEIWMEGDLLRRSR